MVEHQIVARKGVSRTSAKDNATISDCIYEHISDYNGP